jgi:hypothetical protein
MDTDIVMVLPIAVNAGFFVDGDGKRYLPREIKARQNDELLFLNS